MIGVKTLPRWCVYTHSLDGVIIYVGMGSENRAFCASRRTKTWRRFVPNPEKVKVTILKTFKNRIAAIHFEQRKIRSLRPLANVAHNRPYRRVQESFRVRLAEPLLSEVRKASVERRTSPEKIIREALEKVLLTKNALDMKLGVIA